MSPSAPESPTEPASRAREHATDRRLSASVLLVDAQRFVLDGLAALLELESDLEVLGTAMSVDAAAAMAATSPPDVVVLEPALNGEDGLGLLHRFAAGEQRPRTLVLTTQDSPEALHRALAAGVAGYLSKRARYDDVASAIRQTAAGETVISPQFVRQLVSPSASPQQALSAVQLTLREQEVLEQIAAGATNTRIAQKAGISVRTVQKHVENLFHKLGVTDRATLVAAAFRRGLLR